MSADTIEPAAARADAAPLDLLLTDAALGVLNRVNRSGSGLRLAAALAAAARGDLPRSWWPDYTDGLTERCGEEGPAAASPGPGTRGPHCRRAVRGQPAGEPGPGPRAAASHGTSRRGPGLLLPAGLRHRLDQPAAAAQPAAAHADPGRGR